MTPQAKLPEYTKREERVNFISHLAGAIISVLGSVWLIQRAVFNQDARQIACMVIYSITLINLYAFSTLYHSGQDHKRRRLRQKGDHLSISILVAGSVTGILGGGVESTLAYILVGVVWALSILAVVCNSVNVKKFRAVTMTCYIAAGWCPLIAIVPIFEALGTPGFSLLLAGGLFYMFGLIFYAIKKEFMHAIWHFFVLIASILHYLVILVYVL